MKNFIIPIVVSLFTGYAAHCQETLVDSFDYGPPYNDPNITYSDEETIVDPSINGGEVTFRNEGGSGDIEYSLGGRLRLSSSSSQEDFEVIYPNFPTDQLGAGDSIFVYVAEASNLVNVTATIRDDNNPSVNFDELFKFIQTGQNQRKKSFFSGVPLKLTHPFGKSDAPRISSSRPGCGTEKETEPRTMKTTQGTARHEAAISRVSRTPQKNRVRIAKRLPATLGAAALASGLLTESIAAPLEISYNEVKTFDDPVPVAAAQEADKWYPDRYQPAAFEAFELNGENVLRVGIDSSDGAQDRPSNFSSAFYNTQGRKLDLPEGTDRISAKIFFPSSWEGEDVRRRSDVWATAIDGDDNITFYPIIGIANVDDTPVIRYWDGNLDSGNGDWVNTPVVPAADTWHRFDMLLAGSEVVYYVDGTEVGRIGNNGSESLRDAIIQAYNFNDSNLDPEQQSADSYDAYWDDFSVDFALREVVEAVETTRQPDLTVGPRRSPRSHKGAGVLARNPNRQRVVSTAKLRAKAQFYLGLTNAGNETGEMDLKASGRKNRRVRTRIFETGPSSGNVTAKALAGRYTKNLDAGETAVYRVVKRLTARGKRAGRRVTDRTVFRSQADSGRDTASAMVRFRP